MQCPWRSEAPVGVKGISFSMHSMKTTLLAWAIEVEGISEHMRLVQGHHRGRTSLKIYSTDDVFLQLKLQRVLIEAIIRGFRPQMAQDHEQLGRLVQTHLTSFADSDGEEQMLPKHHYTLHLHSFLQRHEVLLKQTHLPGRRGQLSSMRSPYSICMNFSMCFFDVNQGVVKRVYEALISQEGSLGEIGFPSHWKGNKKTLQAMRGKREVIVSKILHPPQVLGRFLRSSVDPQYLSPFEVLGWSLRCPRNFRFMFFKPQE